jgi:hypothetical protein
VMMLQWSTQARGGYGRGILAVSCDFAVLASSAALSVFLPREQSSGGVSCGKVFG